MCKLGFQVFPGGTYFTVMCTRHKTTNCATSLTKTCVFFINLSNIPINQSYLNFYMKNMYNGIFVSRFHEEILRIFKWASTQRKCDVTKTCVVDQLHWKMASKGKPLYTGPKHIDGIPDYGWRVRTDHKFSEKAKPFQIPRLHQIPPLIGMSWR